LTVNPCGSPGRVLDLAQPLAAAAVEVHGAQFDAFFADAAFHAQLAQDAQTVARHVQEQAGVIVMARLRLVDVRLVPGPLQEDGNGRPGDAAADDDRFPVFHGHDLLLENAVNPAFILIIKILRRRLPDLHPVKVCYILIIKISNSILRTTSELSIPARARS
jgi:hypothetical protein